MLDVPIIVIVCGEGGSGGALGIAIGDRVLMQEFSVYSVIPPEGCAAILWRDAKRKVEAADALKITAPDLLALGLIDDDRPGAARRRAQRLRRGDGAASIRRCGSARGALGADRAERLDGATRSSGAWAKRAGIVDLDGPATMPTIDHGLMKTPPLGAPAVRRRGATALGAALNLHPTVARLLCHARARRPRGRRAGSCIRRWTISTIPSCSPTWARRWSASSGRSRAKERIAIHGDYDVDGITSTVILRRALEMLGGDVVHFIPERLRDGYGLQPAAIDRLHAEGVQLIDLGRLRHPRRRGRAPRARARAST